MGKKKIIKTDMLFSACDNFKEPCMAQMEEPYTKSEHKEKTLLFIEDDKITGIEKEEEARYDSKEYEIYDFSNCMVLPGLINSHVHIDMEPIGDVPGYYKNTSVVERTINSQKNLKKYLNSGVTHIRNLGSSDYMDIYLRDLVERGEISGPKIKAAGYCITMTGGHGDVIGIESDGADACRKSARSVIKNGADVVKIMATGGVMTKGVEPGSPQLSYEEILATIEEAHKAGKKTATHAQGAMGIRNAVLAGIDSVEHGMVLTDEIIELMLEKGTYLVPTLVAPYFINEYGIDGGIPEYAVRKARKIAEIHVESFFKAYKAGIKIAMGTDGGTPFNNHELSWMELKLMNKYGMSNEDCLVAATLEGARLLGIENKYGSLEVGKKADIIVVEGNPLIDIEATKNIRAVFQNGQLIKEQ